jgi:hypothetical protein
LRRTRGVAVFIELIAKVLIATLGDVLLLPLPPDAVDLGVVQEEERFCS